MSSSRSDLPDFTHFLAIARHESFRRAGLDPQRFGAEPCAQGARNPAGCAPAQSNQPNRHADGGGRRVALDDIYNDPVKTSVIRRSDREIWLHFTTTSAMGTLTVVETKPFVATARLLPATGLKADIDGKGKAVLHVNFDTGNAAISPASLPQIAEIVTLLKSEPTLRLAIRWLYRRDRRGGP